MARAKAGRRARAAAQRGAQSADRERSEGAPPTEQERAPRRERQSAAAQRGSCARLPGRRGVAGLLLSRLETAAYRIYERVAGLSEERPALGVEIAASALRAFGARAPRVVSSVTVSRARAAVLNALQDAAGVRRLLPSIGRVEAGAKRQASTIRAAGAGGPERTPAGVVSLATAPGDGGTEIKVVLPGARPRGRLARAAGELLAELPRRQLRGELRRLRQWIEIGEIPTTAGQPSGRTDREGE
ncbi:hypothetical protein [Sorangium atrum]|uniref:Ribosome-binding factor A n=1 Tax=Sorangium atrum TaxID=2995308 RepID=A0ABT5BU61_9BACT|nr:hypothetical protein [Sorangium aterium]MDC0677681.1 hypothetical protein [Sorangium aterium]